MCAQYPSVRIHVIAGNRYGSGKIRQKSAVISVRNKTDILAVLCGGGRYARFERNSADLVFIEIPDRKHKTGKRVPTYPVQHIALILTAVFTAPQHRPAAGFRRARIMPCGDRAAAE